MRLRITGALLAAGASATLAVVAVAPVHAASSPSAAGPANGITIPGTGIPGLPGGPSAPTPPPAQSTVCVAPTITGIAYTWAPPAGSSGPAWQQPSPQVAPWNADSGTLTVSGSNLVQQGCTPEVSIGGVALSGYNPSTSSRPPSAGSSSGTSAQTINVDFTLASPLPASTNQAASPLNPNGSGPNIAAGVVKVTETDPTLAVQDSTKDAHQFVLVQEPAAPFTVSSATPHEGDTETIGAPSGGLSQFESGQPGAVTNALLATSFAGCDGSSVAASWAPPADTQKNPLDQNVTTTVPQSYCDGALSLQFAFTPDLSQPSYCNQTPPAGAPANCVTFAESAGNVDVSFDPGKPQPNPVGPGGTIIVTGFGFGSTGTARIDNTSLGAPVLWNDHVAELRAPSQPMNGTLYMQRTQPNGDNATVALGPFAVSNGAPTGLNNQQLASLPLGYLIAGARPSFSPGRLGISPAAGTTASPVGNQLKINLPAKAIAGTDVNYSLTLEIDGHPVAGAPVTLSIVSSPGPDAKLKPTTGVTDGQGRLAGTVHLSSNPGTMLFTARSGQYSDEGSIIGTKSTSSGLKLPFGLTIDFGGNPLALWLTVATALLIILGVVVNLDVLRRVLWSATLGKLFRRLRTRPTASA